MDGVGNHSGKKNNKDKSKISIPTRVRLISGIVQLYLQIANTIPPPQIWHMSEDQLGEMVVKLSDRAFKDLMNQSVLKSQTNNKEVYYIWEVNRL